MLLGSVGGEPRAPTEAPSPLIGKCMRALDLMAKHVGASVRARVRVSECVGLGARVCL